MNERTLTGNPTEQEIFQRFRHGVNFLLCICRVLFPFFNISFTNVHTFIIISL